MVKLGGSFLTDKSRTAFLYEDRVRNAGRQIQEALDHDPNLRIILGHGAGSFGHTLARDFRAVEGWNEEFGWRAFRTIRRSMARMNLKLLEIWNEERFHPVTVHPGSVALARDGILCGMDLTVLAILLEHGQVPLVHGEVVLDTERGFTIISTEDQFRYLATQFPVTRVVMVSDVPGVLDEQGRTIPELGPQDIEGVPVGASTAADVTGGMRHKLESLLAILHSRPGVEARIVSGLNHGVPAIRDAILGRTSCGTRVRLD
jgi:isopentenyl phosphate kinase